MKLPVLPTQSVRPLPFYLAMEEWIARAMPADEYFFVWRVNPTVICGRNQDIATEVDLEYCRGKGIEVVRRRSGGGCVYADMDNLMFSYITSDSEVSSTFARYTGMITEMLRSLGFDAKATGRNDIFIGDKKVAGNAYYHLHDRAIVHGTMLCNIDMENMSRAITPSRAKLQSKAVKSVESHVTCLKDEGLSLNIEEFSDYAVDYLCGNNRVLLTDENICEIVKIQKRYYAPEYLYGRHSSHSLPESGSTIRRKRRIEGVGEFDITISLDKRNRITDLSFAGDFFVTGDLQRDLITPFIGVEYTDHYLAQVINSLHPEYIIAGLAKDLLYSLLIETE